MWRSGAEHSAGGDGYHYPCRLGVGDSFAGAGRDQEIVAEDCAVEVEGDKLDVIVLNFELSFWLVALRVAFRVSGFDNHYPIVAGEVFADFHTCTWEGGAGEVGHYLALGVGGLHDDCAAWV